MTKKGQTTILLLILIPIIFLVMAFVADSALMIVEKSKFTSTTKTIIKDILANSYIDYEKNVKEMYEKNKYETDFLVVEYQDDILRIYNSHSYTSFLGYVIGKKEYRCEVDLRGYVENDKVIIEEVENE